MTAFDDWTKSFAQFVGEKGKVKAGKYRAYGVKRGSFFLQEIPPWSRSSIAAVDPDNATVKALKITIELSHLQ
ncbi:MAG: hypothetical protein WC714_11475 [Candidatus Obscuribacterales bacterium]